MSLNSRLHLWEVSMTNKSTIITKYLFQIATILITLLAVNGLQEQQTKSIILHFMQELKCFHSAPNQHVKTSQDLKTINNVHFRNCFTHYALLIILNKQF